jgi:hypothetical protein
VQPSRLGHLFAFDGLAPVYVYRFDALNKVRRLGARQAQAAREGINTTGDVVRVIVSPGIDAGQPVAAVLYNGAVVYLNVRITNSGKRVRGLMVDNSQGTRWVQFDPKGWATWRAQSMAAGVLAW